MSITQIFFFNYLYTYIVLHILNICSSVHFHHTQLREFALVLQKLTPQGTETCGYV